jgi:hypothetical protein
MAGLFLGIVLFFVSLVSPLSAEELAMRDARVTDAVGQVTVKTMDHPKQAVTVDEETPLAEEDVLETGLKSSAEITMDGETVFKLGAGSSLRIKKLFLKNTQMELSQGILLAKVKPATQPDQSLILKMPTAVVAIRGTEFAIQTGDGVSQVGVFDEGHVVVAGAWAHEHVILAPNQETKVTLSNVPKPPRRLAHFRTYRGQIVHLRSRAVYWHKIWTPLSPDRKQAIRNRLADPHRSKSQGFRNPPAPKPIHHRVVRKKHVTKKVHHSQKTHAQTPRTKRHHAQPSDPSQNK